MHKNIDYQNLTDEELVKISLSNQDVYVYLIKRYEKQLLRYVFRLSSFSHDEAEDVVQEVFIKVYQNLNNFDHKLKFSSWIYRITHNQVISTFRKNKRQIRSVTWDVDNELVQNLKSDFDIGKELDNNYLQKEIKKVLDKMDFKYAQVLALKFLENKSYKEISDILQKPQGTVATLINRAKKNFHKELAKQDIKI